MVTATKRSVGMQDVPIAISVVSGDKIEKFGVTELDELSAYLPNVHIGESGGNNQIFIRGVGSGNNSGFEQSVGTFIDGVYYGRARNSRAAFLDIERVEVLKGPQSTLFGKNTIAGAINITTAQPADAFEAYVDASYETELDGIGLTGMVTGPLTDRLRGRLVAKTFERDGWMENQFPGADDGASQENDIVRGTLVWDATDNSSLNLKAEYGEFGTVGATSKIVEAEPGSIFLFSFNDPDFGDTVNNGYKQSQTQGLPGRDIVDDTEAGSLQLTWITNWATTPCAPSVLIPPTILIDVSMLTMHRSISLTSVLTSHTNNLPRNFCLPRRWAKQLNTWPVFTIRMPRLISTMRVG